MFDLGAEGAAESNCHGEVFVEVEDAGFGVQLLAVGLRTDRDERGGIWILSVDRKPFRVERWMTIGRPEGLRLRPGDRFGQSLARLSDLGDDGFVDLVVGAPGDDVGGKDAGAIWLLLLDESVLASQANGL